tara:strand:- start:515 stop:1009 length:495 start_codon:yes stop_codon:yes gene_type:complete
MGLEIERRFLVKSNEWQKFVHNSQQLKQGYLVTESNKWTIRVRIANQKKSWLTLKHSKEGIIRHEFEYMIPIDEGLSIWEMSNFKIYKTRYELDINNHSWIVDCFKDKNFPLTIAEIELNEINQEIDIPKWCDSEISHSKEFSNAALAKSPIATWPIEKKHLIL